VLEPFCLRPRGRRSQTLLLRESPVAREHITDYLLGKSYLDSVRRHCAACLEQEGEAASNTIRALAGLGGSGARHECSNVERDFWRMHWTELDCVEMPQPHFIDLTVRSKSRHGSKVIKFPVILPCDWLHFLGKNPTVFDNVLGADDNAITEYWMYERTRPVDQRHPFLNAVDHDGASPASGIPYALHGDDVRVYQNENVLVLSIRSVTAHKYPRHSHLLYAVLPLSLCIEGVTLWELYESFVKFANDAYHGSFSETDLDGDFWEQGSWRQRMAGSKLCERYDAQGNVIGFYRLCFAQGEGDWKWVKETFHYQGYQHNNCCQFCMASKVDPDRFYTDVSDTAAWRRLRIWHDTYMRDIPDNKRSPLIYLIGFHLYRIWVDSMHCLDIKGVASYIHGNIILDICEQQHFGSDSRANRLARCHADYKEFNHTHGISDTAELFTAETLNVSDTSGVYLSGKGAQVRRMSAWSLDISKRLSAGSGHDVMRIACAWGLHEYNTLIATSPPFLDAATIQRLVFAVRVCLTCYYVLRREASAAGLFRRWRPKPKQHQWLHLVEDFVVSTRRNPRSAWCYGNEDFVGFVRRIMAKCPRLNIAVRTTHKMVLLWALFCAMVRDNRVDGPLAGLS
jgi:hypothetical protein